MKIQMTPSIEDYLGTIYRLDKGNGVRSIDVANTLGVSKPSVNRALKTLQSHHYITQEPYQDIYLTPLGRQKGQELNMRYSVLKGFLVHVLGVDEKIAQEAGFMEHGMSHDTIERVSEFMRNYSLREGESKVKALNIKSNKDGNTKV